MTHFRFKLLKYDTKHTQQAIIAETIVDGLVRTRAITAGEVPKVRARLICDLDRYASRQNLEDMAGFINYGHKSKKASDYLTTHLLHDVIGLAKGGPCFLPRTSGYAEELKEAAL